MATKLLPEERRRQKTAYRRQGAPAPSLLQRICSFRIKYRQLKMVIIGLFGIIGGIWALISLLEIKFLGPW